MTMEATSTFDRETLERLAAAGLDPARLPRHVAVIMDGNGRWAQRQGLPRIEGHRRGVASVRAITEECSRLGMEQLTLYCLSSENWKRPKHELSFLMHLLEQYMIEERTTIMENDIRVAVIGKREGIPQVTLDEMDKTIAMTAAMSIPLLFGLTLDAPEFGGFASMVFLFWYS